MLGPRLKPIHEQVIVITGASSGIGLTTAQMAAEQGATVVLSARNEDALEQHVNELVRNGKKASFFRADVSKQEDLQNLSNHALELHGRIDTWVNDAAAPLYGELLDVPIEDHRRVFEVNYWGVVYGSLVAVNAMKQYGGAIVNIGSILSEIPIPLQGPYVASKHAVKGFSDVLRIELRKRGLPITVSLIKPAGIDTPYSDHARVYNMDKAPVVPPIRYVPEIPAKAILYAAQHGTREIYAGGTGRLMVAAQKIAPGFYDWVNRIGGYWLQKSSQSFERQADRRDNLYEPKVDAKRGLAAEGWARKTSLFTEMQFRPWLSTLGVLLVLFIVGTALYMVV